MKKYLAYLLSFILIIFICFFAFNIFLKTYFNKSFYSLPNLVGMNLEQVNKIDSIDKINVIVAGNDFSNLPAGTIFKQNPAAEKVVKEGRTVRVWLSKGKDDYTMPDYTNKNLIEVSARLQEEGIKIKKVSYTSSNLPYNTVLATTPSVGQSTQKNKGVSLLLSNSNSIASVEVPDTIGFTFEEANNELISKGLIIGVVKEKVVPGLEKGIVIETTHIGEAVPAGTIIDIVVSY
ncbi:PASTA domain-containing protein [Cetobacterium somerae]|uniref:PASTA domain-containing protein n=1 Tax=Cetobacterium sp. NK01 TaxID=2993530 RepID=UPI0021162B23|nr:PASTA domain-containing protein [Cetobacterium sp. NK01]MCQ8211368.1 PASTA domain-containing protein [Cetobacterium sp. NK01]